MECCKADHFDGKRAVVRISKQEHVFQLITHERVKHGTDGKRGKIRLLTDGKRAGENIEPRLALILLLIGCEDSIVILIGQNEPIFPRNN